MKCRVGMAMCTVFALATGLGYDDVEWRFWYSNRPLDVISVADSEATQTIIARSVWSGAPEDSREVMAKDIYVDLSEWTSVRCRPQGFCVIFN